MLAATFFDPVLGLDTHIVLVPTPAGPVPTPMPMPFVGMVFDPAGLALGAAMGAALSGSPGLVMVNSMPAGNCGTAVTNTMTAPHIPAPGPFAVGMPGNDAETMFGGLNASVGGSFGLRLGDIALSCSDPVRMPTSVVLAIPKGMPFLLLRPPVPDIATILMGLAMKAAFRAAAAALRFLVRQGRRLFRMLRAVQRRAGSSWERAAQRAHGAVDRVFGNPSRMRNRIHDAVCFVTGHPVDVATGRMFTEVEDFSLPGPIPLRFVRRYDSNRSSRKGVLGHGWSHSLEQSIWLERGRVVLWDSDGREIEVQTLDLPGRELAVGQRIEHLREGLLVKRTADRDFEVETRDGLVRVFRDVGGHPKGRWVAKLAAIRHRSGNAIDLAYDGRGLLTHVRDSSGRIFELAYDVDGMLALVKLPVRVGHGLYMHRRYEYDARFDLVQVTDSMGRAYRYEYVNHLMVRETDRAGLSFHFVYDGRSSGAKCVRTWGDGGIYDHLVHYDAKNRKTIVESSTGHVTVYERDPFDQVVKILDAHGGEIIYAYDETHGLEVKSTDAGGGTVERSYDARARLVQVKGPDGATIRFGYDARDLLAEVVDANGGRRVYDYDAAWQLRESRRPDGTASRFHWSAGCLVAVDSAEGRRTVFEYDAQKMVRAVHGPKGLVVEAWYDNQGACVKERTAVGAIQRRRVDSEGRLVELESLAGTVGAYAYDGEGNLVEARDPTRHVRMRYGHFHRVIEREQGGALVRFDYDTEDRLVEVANEAGERWRFELDGLGNVTKEVAFDGSERMHLRDPLGRVVKTLLPDLRMITYSYDAAGRVIGVGYPDGTKAEFHYGPDGRLVRAKNDAATVAYERDALGRVRTETIDDVVVESGFGPDGLRSSGRTSLGAEWWAAFDPLGDLDALSIGPTPGARDGEIRFERDALGREVARAMPGGVRVEWQRDVAGRPLARRITRSRVGEVPWELGLVRYGFRGEDQLSSLLDPIAGPRFFDHDARGRVVRERRADRAIDRAMDEVGNVYRAADRSDRRYGRGGRLEEAAGSRFEHDAEGRPIRKITSDGRQWEYQWNGAGLLAEVATPEGTRVRFAYDPFARRTAKTRVRIDAEGAEQVERETRYVWDGPRLVHELDSHSGRTDWYWQPGTHTPVAKVNEGRRWAIASDHLGTPTEMFDATGRLAWKMQLDVFGVATVDTGSASDCPWRWPGQYEDEETGLRYNRFRYYDADVGAYLSPDPAGLAGGFRPFGYPVDPLLGFDPLGLYEPWEVAPYGSTGHRGDGLDADEMLGSVWLREHGQGDRQSAIGRQNPAIAMDPALHRQVTSAQREAGLFDHATVRGQTAMENIAHNYDVRMRVLAEHFEGQGMTGRQARAEARRVLTPLREDAEAFARRIGCG